MAEPNDVPKLDATTKPRKTSKSDRKDKSNSKLEVSPNAEPNAAQNKTIQVILNTKGSKCISGQASY